MSSSMMPSLPSASSARVAIVLEQLQLYSATLYIHNITVSCNPVDAACSVFYVMTILQVFNFSLMHIELSFFSLTGSGTPNAAAFLDTSGVAIFRVNSDSVFLFRHSSYAASCSGISVPCAMFTFNKGADISASSYFSIESSTVAVSAGSIMKQFGPTVSVSTYSSLIVYNSTILCGWTTRECFSMASGIITQVAPSTLLFFRNTVTLGPSVWISTALATIGWTVGCSNINISAVLNSIASEITACTLCGVNDCNAGLATSAQPVPSTYGGLQCKCSCTSTQIVQIGALCYPLVTNSKFVRTVSASLSSGDATESVSSSIDRTQETTRSVTTSMELSQSATSRTAASPTTTLTVSFGTMETSGSGTATTSTSQSRHTATATFSGPTTSRSSRSQRSLTVSPPSRSESATKLLTISPLPSTSLSQLRTKTIVTPSISASTSESYDPCDGLAPFVNSSGGFVDHLNASWDPSTPLDSLAESVDVNVPSSAFSASALRAVVLNLTFASHFAFVPPNISSDRLPCVCVGPAASCSAHMVSLRPAVVSVVLGPLMGVSATRTHPVFISVAINTTALTCSRKLPRQITFRFTVPADSQFPQPRPLFVGIIATGTLVSVTAGNSVLGSVVSRIPLVIGAATCGAVSVDPSNSVFSLWIAPQDELAYGRGAVVGNLPLVAVFLLGPVALAWGSAMLAGTSLRSSLEKFRFPSAASLPAVVVLQPTISSCVTLMMHANASPLDHVLGLAGLIFALAYVLCAVVVVMRNPFPLVLAGTNSENVDSPIPYFIRLWFFPPRKWVSPHDATDDDRRWARRNRLLFDDYRFQFYVLVDVVVPGVICGVAGGVQLPDMAYCYVALVAEIVVLVALTILAVLFSPFLTRANNWLSIIANALSAAAIGCHLGAFATDNSVWNDVADVLTLILSAASIVQTLPTLFMILKLAHRRLCSVAAGRTDSNNNGAHLAVIGADDLSLEMLLLPPPPNNTPLQELEHPRLDDGADTPTVGANRNSSTSPREVIVSSQLVDHRNTFAASQAEKSYSQPSAAEEFDLNLLAGSDEAEGEDDKEDDSDLDGLSVRLMQNPLDELERV